MYPTENVGKLFTDFPDKNVTSHADMMTWEYYKTRKLGQFCQICLICKTIDPEW